MFLIYTIWKRSAKVALRGTRHNMGALFKNEKWLFRVPLERGGSSSRLYRPLCKRCHRATPFAGNTFHSILAFLLVIVCMHSQHSSTVVEIEYRRRLHHDRRPCAAHFRWSIVHIKLPNASSQKSQSHHIPSTKLQWHQIAFRSQYCIESTLKNFREKHFANGILITRKRPQKKLNSANHFEMNVS